MAAVRQLTDEQKIFETFKDDPDWTVRQTVVENLSDEQLILNTFKDDKAWQVRDAVAKKLSDMESLIEFVYDSDEYVRQTVTNKLSEINNEFSDALKQLDNVNELEL